MVNTNSNSGTLIHFLFLQRIVFSPMPGREAKTSSPKLKPPKAIFLSYEVSFIKRGITFQVLMTHGLPP